MQKHTIFVFANLKPSQIRYKIIPLCLSQNVEKVIVLRKKFMEIHEEKVICHSIPSWLQTRPLYWIFVPFYGIWLIRKYRVSIILNYNIFPHGFNAFFASLFTRKPVIFSEINEDTIIYHSRSLTRPLIRAILSNARYITVPGSSTRRYWEKSGYNKLLRLHSTINTDVFKADSKKDKVFDFLYIGEFDQNKRPDLILDSFLELRKKGISASLCLIGYGVLEEKLKQRVEDHSASKEVTIIKTQEVLHYLQQSKIFIMASISEGLPCAMMEAMACELIPIVTAAGDIADVVVPGVNGYLHNGTKEELTALMEQTLSNYEQLESLQVRARKTIMEDHSYSVATQKWNELLESITN